MYFRLSLGCGAAALLAMGCGTSPPTCQDIVRQYESEIANASFCDPTVADPCSVLLPVVVAVAVADGGTTFEAFGTCNVGFNPARSAKLQQLVLSYQQMGCLVQFVPVCPTYPPQCIQGRIGFTCQP
jgi:hypothetical protein